MNTKSRRWITRGMLLPTILLLAGGCVVNGRRVLLKEYGPSVPVVAGDALRGKVIALKGFNSVTNLVKPDPTTKPIEPEGFKYEPQSKEHDQLWSAEMLKLQRSVKKDRWILIGNMRNGLGMVMSHVYTLNDPAEWLTQSLKFDLEAQGARVVDASQAATADATVSGTIRLCRADMYFTVNGTMVVDVEWQIGSGEVRRRQIHTHGATAAMLASEGEYFHALRDARQKVSIFIIQDVVAGLKAK